MQTSEGRTQAHLVPYSTGQMDTNGVSKGLVWWFMGERENGSGSIDRSKEKREREWVEMER